MIDDINTDDDEIVLRFQNMKANLLLEGKYQEEEIAIKNVWHKGVSVFFDLYLHNIDKPLIVDALYIRELEDIDEEVSYPSVKEFIDEFLNYKYDKKSNFQGSKSDENVQMLESLHNDIVILTFMAKFDNGISEVKTRSIEDYIGKTKPETSSLSDKYIRNYIDGINPTLEDFYASLAKIGEKTPRDASKLFMEAAKVATSNGFITYIERVYLAEIMESLRENGFSLKDCVI